IARDAQPRKLPVPPASVQPSPVTRCVNVESLRTWELGFAFIPSYRRPAKHSYDAGRHLRWASCRRVAKTLEKGCFGVKVPPLADGQGLRTEEQRRSTWAPGRRL